MYRYGDHGPRRHCHIQVTVRQHSAVKVNGLYRIRLIKRIVAIHRRTRKQARLD